jgi:hypothetical protein
VKCLCAREWRWQFPGWASAFGGLEHRLVSRNGTRTVGGKERQGKARKSKEKRFVGKAEETARVRTDDTMVMTKRESLYSRSI